MITAKDISRWQGNWQDTGEPIVMIKMSGGDDGLYLDSQATSNYEKAISAGKAVGGYHFIGWTLGASAEATYFLQAMSPVAENDVYCLDIEAIPAGVDPVPYVTEMINQIHDKINVWCLVYMNLSTLNAHDWNVVLTNCGLWLADWAVSPDQNIPTLHTYVMQQYADGPSYDHDEWFGDINQFKAYGYHTLQAPTPPPVQPPAETPPPAVTSIPVTTDPTLGITTITNIPQVPDVSVTPIVLPNLTNNTPGNITVLPKPSTQPVAVSKIPSKSTITTILAAIGAAIALLVAWLHL